MTLKQNIKMYKKALILLIICVSCLLSSCRVTRQEIQKTENETIVEKEKTVSYKDTTLFAPKAETSLKIPISEIGFKNDLKPILKPVNYSKKNGQANIKLQIVHDTIYATATCDSVALRAQIRSEILKEFSNKTKNNIESNKTKTGYTFFDLILAFCAGFLACYILKILKIV